MVSSHDQTSFNRKLVATCALGCLLTGCTVVDPTAIRSGRLAYNDAINETNRQQLLMVVIYNRYEEADNLLAVASVTANASIRASGGIQLGFGDADNYAGTWCPSVPAAPTKRIRPFPTSLFPGKTIRGS